jgi:hypothetical protein
MESLRAKYSTLFYTMWSNTAAGHSLQVQKYLITPGINYSLFTFLCQTYCFPELAAALL